MEKSKPESRQVLETDEEKAFNHEKDKLARVERELLPILMRSASSIEEQALLEHFQVTRDALVTVIQKLRSAINRYGLEILQSANGYRLATHPSVYHSLKEFFSDIKEATLSPQALEVLAIIAYKQPITRAEIEDIRNKASDWIIRSLLQKRLIKVKGRAKTPGRPFLYVTTNLFLESFGLSSLEELPKLDFSEIEKSLTEMEQEKAEE